MIHWAVKYIGKPWINGEYDCWGLVRDIYKNELQIELSPIVTDATNLRDVLCEFRKFSNYNHLQETSDFKDKNIVILTQNKYPCHVGVYCDADGGGVLHNMQGVGVVFQKLPELKMNGWQIMEILEYEETF
nr:MAG TPA: resuscitation promoting factor interacting protein [Caudoviricetes sp.]